MLLPFSEFYLLVLITPYVFHVWIIQVATWRIWSKAVHTAFSVSKPYNLVYSIMGGGMWREWERARVGEWGVRKLEISLSTFFKISLSFILFLGMLLLNSVFPFSCYLLSQRKMCSLLFKFLHVQLLAGQHSILRDIWIMMDILSPLPQLMQLQQVEFLLGIGERPLEMVTLQLNLTVLWNWLNRHHFL